MLTRVASIGSPRAWHCSASRRTLSATASRKGAGRIESANRAGSAYCAATSEPYQDDLLAAYLDAKPLVGSKDRERREALQRGGTRDNGVSRQLRPVPEGGDAARRRPVRGHGPCARGRAQACLCQPARSRADRSEPRPALPRAVARCTVGGLRGCAHPRRLRIRGSRQLARRGAARGARPRARAARAG